MSFYSSIINWMRGLRNNNGSLYVDGNKYIFGTILSGSYVNAKTDDNYFEKKKEFDDRYARTVKRSQRYAKRLFAFRLIEFLIKGTSDEKECLSKESFFKEHTQLIKDIEAELP